MHTYTSTHIYTYVHTHLHMHTSTCTHAHIHTYHTYNTLMRQTHMPVNWDQKAIILLAAKISGRERIKESAHARVLSLWICMTWRIRTRVSSKGVIIEHSIPRIQGWHTRLKRSSNDLCVCARHCAHPLAPLLSWLSLLLCLFEALILPLSLMRTIAVTCTRGVVVICSRQKRDDDFFYYFKK